VAAFTPSSLQAWPIDIQSEGAAVVAAIRDLRGKSGEIYRIVGAGSKPWLGKIGEVFYPQSGDSTEVAQICR